MNHLEYKRTLTAEQAIDEELVNCHLGTLESFESPWEALHALMIFHQSVGEYFAKKKSECVDSLYERIKLLEKRVIDLQGHDDLSYIDRKLSEQEGE